MSVDTLTATGGASVLHSGFDPGVMEGFAALSQDQAATVHRPREGSGANPFADGVAAFSLPDAGDLIT